MTSTMLVALAEASYYFSRDKTSIYCQYKIKVQCDIIFNDRSKMELNLSIYSLVFKRDKNSNGASYISALIDINCNPFSNIPI